MSREEIRYWMSDEEDFDDFDDLSEGFDKDLDELETELEEDDEFGDSAIVEATIVREEIVPMPPTPAPVAAPKPPSASNPMIKKAPTAPKAAKKTMPKVAKKAAKKV